MHKLATRMKNILFTDLQTVKVISDLKTHLKVVIIVSHITLLFTLCLRTFGFTECLCINFEIKLWILFHSMDYADILMVFF